MKKVKDFEMYSVTKDGRIYSHISNRFLKEYNHNHGYLSTAFHKDGKSHSKLIHRVVAEAYLPNPDNLPTVNHKDGDKTNNNVSNLEWCSYADNNLHAIENGLRGDTRKYSEDLVLRVMTLVADGWRQKDICDSLNLTMSQIKVMLHEPSYNHIRDLVDWSNWRPRNQSVSDTSVLKVCDLLEAGLTRTPASGRIKT